MNLEWILKGDHNCLWNGFWGQIRTGVPFVTSQRGSYLELCVFAHIFWIKEVDRELLLLLGVLFFSRKFFENLETDSQKPSMNFAHCESLLTSNPKLNSPQSFLTGLHRRHVSHRFVLASRNWILIWIWIQIFKRNLFRLFLMWFAQVSVGFFSVELWRNMRRSRWHFFPLSFTVWGVAQSLNDSKTQLLQREHATSQSHALYAVS